MANLKIDLVNILNNKKYYSELEVIRLAQDSSMNYEEKLIGIDAEFERLVIINAKVGLVEQYFKEQQPVEQQLAEQPHQQQPPQQQPAVVHNGQTHGE